MARSKPNPQVSLRPQDVVVLLRLALDRQTSPGYATLAAELCMTASEAHAAVERAVAAGLARKEAGRPRVLMEPLRQFVQHGLRYSFPATRGEVTRGMPTGYAAPPLVSQIVQPNEPVPVWPFKSGTVRGVALYPLYPTVPDAASRDPALYEVLALVDAVRAGSMRERAIALTELDRRWGVA